MCALYSCISDISALWPAPPQRFLPASLLQLTVDTLVSRVVSPTVGWRGVDLSVKHFTFSVKVKSEEGGRCVGRVSSY